MRSCVGVVWARNMDLEAVLAAPNPSSIFTKDGDKDAKAHLVDHSLPTPNPALFPLHHGTLPFLASWLEYLFSPLCTTANKSEIDLGVSKLRIVIACGWTEGSTYWPQSEERYFGVQINLQWREGAGGAPSNSVQ